jgi:hypothetical protein
MGFKLGDKVRDRVDGFEGILSGRAEYLYDTVRCLVEAPAKDGKTCSSWIAESRLEVAGTAADPKADKVKPPPTKAEKEYVAPTPCKGCGVNLDDPKAEHSAACEVEIERLAKAAPVEDAAIKPNGKKVSPEEMAAEAKDLFVKLAQATSRETVVKLLQEFGVAKVSEVPVAKLPEFVAALRAASKKVAAK